MVSIIIVISLRHFCPMGKGSMKLSLCAAPTCKTRSDQTNGTTYPTLFDKCVGSFKSPVNHLTLMMQETGPTVYEVTVYEVLIIALIV